MTVTHAANDISRKIKAAQETFCSADGWGHLEALCALAIRANAKQSPMAMLKSAGTGVVDASGFMDMINRRMDSANRRGDFAAYAVLSELRTALMYEGKLRHDGKGG